SSIIVALPLIPVLIILAWSLMRWLKADFADLEDHQHLIAHQPLSPFAGLCEAAPTDLAR
ncbi:MAG: BCCT family betaine/carnitine transporter, partial [Hydrogenophaga sp.]